MVLGRNRRISNGIHPSCQGLSSREPPEKHPVRRHGFGSVSGVRYRKHIASGRLRKVQRLPIERNKPCCRGGSPPIGLCTPTVRLGQMNCGTTVSPVRLPAWCDDRRHHCTAELRRMGSAGAENCAEQSLPELPDQDRRSRRNSSAILHPSRSCHSSPNCSQLPLLPPTRPRP